MAFLEGWLKNDMKGYEFGSGRSTKWFTDRDFFIFQLKLFYIWFEKSV